MFKWYGLAGILLIIFVEMNFFLHVEPLIYLSFPLAWIGYILVVDAVVYKIRRHSLISNRFQQFLGMFIISTVFWWIFEFLNIPVQNWLYIGGEHLGVYIHLFTFISFGTVLPALFETVELIKSVHLFKDVKQRKRKISKNTLHFIMIVGMLCFIAPILLPLYTYPLIWASIFLILDPINYIHRQPSVIGHIKEGRRQ